jgi:OmpA-OmpF porin, OOP family
MKKNLALSSLTCIGAALAALSVHAQETRFYVRGDVGGTITPDTEVKEFFGPVAPGTKIKFDPGVRLGVAGGYQVTDWFAAEAQTGVMANSIKSITGADRVDAVFSNVPFLINARFQCPTRKCPFTPYAGGGLGVSISSIDVDHIDLNGTSIDGAEADAVFAYQAFAGVRYALNPQMGLSLEYRYFATTEPSCDAQNISGQMGLGRIETHAFTIAFDYKF